jgi:N-acetylglucosamine-6-phosphate deacetylase
MPAHELLGKDPGSGKTLRVSLEDGRIARIDESDVASDGFLSQGFVDLQVNGFAGFDINADDVTTGTVTALVEALLKRGTTCVVPTIITATEEKICHVLAVIAEARRRVPHVAACIPHIHVEGPHISPRDGYRGAHNAAWVRPPRLDEFVRWQNAGEGLVGMVTLSPHFAESPCYIANVTRRGVQVALGHTDAEGEEIRRAVDAGSTLTTHLGNGLAEMIPRHRNALWSQLADDRLTASVIADGHHLPEDLLRVILRSKGRQRVVLVSDSVAFATMPPGEFATPVGGRVQLRDDGRLCVAGTDLLAGSTATMADCVAGMMRMAGVPLVEALGMATVQPGKFAGGRGRFEVGAAADLIRFRWREGIEIENVWLRGECVYARSA